MIMILFIATKKEAREAFRKMKNDETIDCVILFSGTWVWAAKSDCSSKGLCEFRKGNTYPGPILVHRDGDL
ncbi:MAG: hypothetical protein U5N58_07145 [Actinomycetota bacterium]|nr:hypothetical protein [Actinomycetota bacterium]